MATYYKLLSGSHVRWEGSKKNGAFFRYEAGTDHDTMADLTKEELANFNRKDAPARVKPSGPPKAGTVVPQLASGNRTKESTTGEEEEQEQEQEEESETAWFTDLNVADATEALANVETVEELGKLRDAEEAKGKGKRVTLLRAIDDRIAELS